MPVIGAVRTGEVGPRRLHQGRAACPQLQSAGPDAFIRPHGDGLDLAPLTILTKTSDGDCRQGVLTVGSGGAAQLGWHAGGRL